MVVWFMVVCGFSAGTHRAAVKTTFLGIHSSAPSSTNPEGSLEQHLESWDLEGFWGMEAGKGCGERAYIVGSGLRGQSPSLGFCCCFGVFGWVQWQAIL